MAVMPGPSVPPAHSGRRLGSPAGSLEVQGSPAVAPGPRGRGPALQPAAGGQARPAWPGLGSTAGPAQARPGGGTTREPRSPGRLRARPVCHVAPPAPLRLEQNQAHRPPARPQGCPRSGRQTQVQPVPSAPPGCRSDTGPHPIRLPVAGAAQRFRLRSSRGRRGRGEGWGGARSLQPSELSLSLPLAWSPRGSQSPALRGFMVASLLRHN